MNDVRRMLILKFEFFDTTIKESCEKLDSLSCKPGNLISTRKSAAGFF